MALREIDFTIGEKGGRDKGKTFHLKEMGAHPFFNLTLKVLCAVSASDPSMNIDIDGEVQALTESVIKALFRCEYFVVKPILDELLTCATIRHNDKLNRLIVEGDIEEAGTIVSLMKQVFWLHVGF